ncbi:hypothetical protein DWB79_01250 [Treponema medium]|uniref:DUF5723 domain-containing protein n=2 Tax=Treponema medium TaxID=58231 RepID=A0AA87NMY9_TREMD|nr:hypothetical protein [Treponema medium]EPF29547.1 hypothetical protein HMPREF9195_00248 [Treponema medium ATCC 700293]QSH96409.1 hypothetical protein DWB79_01250 [Treponema medium]
MKKVFCIALLIIPLVCTAYAEPQAEGGGAPALGYGNGAGIVIKTQQGSAAFSWNRLAASLSFRYGCAAVTGGSATLLSGFSNASAESLLRHGSAAVEAGTEDSLCAVGFRAGLTEWELNRLRIRLPNTELREDHLVHRFYSAGISCGVPAYRIRYDGAWYWGQAAIGLHDLSFLIAQPSLEAIASIHRFRLTQWYEGSIAALKLKGVLTNKTGESVASGAARVFAFQNTIYVPIAAHSALSLFASYIYFSGTFSIRLTAANQGYFLFPYRFYNRDISISGSVLGFGGSYRYTADRFRFYGAVQCYSVVNDTGSDVLHSKEKKSFLFKGKEEKSSTPLPTLTGTSLLLLYFSIGFAVTPNVELSAGRIIPVPILSPQLAKQLDTGKGRLSALIIDPLLTGLSIRLTVRL